MAPGQDAATVRSTRLRLAGSKAQLRHLRVWGVHLALTLTANGSQVVNGPATSSHHNVVLCTDLWQEVSACRQCLGGIERDAGNRRHFKGLCGVEGVGWQQRVKKCERRWGEHVMPPRHTVGFRSTGGLGTPLPCAIHKARSVLDGAGARVGRSVLAASLLLLVFLNTYIVLKGRAQRREVGGGRRGRGRCEDGACVSPWCRVCAHEACARLCFLHPAIGAG